MLMGNAIGIGFSGKRKLTIVRDRFNRADSALTLGNAETGQAWAYPLGTWGISGNQAYSASDVLGDIAWLETGNKDYILSCITNGQTTAGANQRFFNVLFRGNDIANFLMVRVTAGTVTLWKNIASAFTMIASSAYVDVDNVDINFTVRCAGNQVTIYVNGVQYINYTLTGGETVFATYTKIGMRLAKFGSPLGTARADNFLMEEI